MPLRLRQLLKGAMKRRFYFPALFFAACWLLLSSQLALASHHTGHDGESMASMPSMNMNMDDTMSRYMQHIVDMDMPVHKILCDKHCHPDNGQVQNHKLQPDMLPANIEMRLAERQQNVCVQPVSYRTPPAIGPPAEIRFCRFRE